MYFKDSNNSWPDRKLYIMTINSLKKCSGLVSTLSMNDQRARMMRIKFWRRCNSPVYNNVYCSSTTSKIGFRLSLCAAQGQFAGHGSSSSSDGLEKLPSSNTATGHAYKRTDDRNERTDRRAEMTRWLAVGTGHGPLQDNRLGSCRSLHIQYRLGVLITEAGTPYPSYSNWPQDS